MKKVKGSLIADLSLLIVALVWGSGFIATRFGLNSITPLYLMAFRFFLAFIILIIVFSKRLKMLNNKNIIGGLVIGFFLFGGFAFQTIGLLYTTAGKQAFLTGTNVVMVPFLYWIVKGKRPDVYSFIATFLTFLGISLLSLNNGLTINLGDSLTIFCAFFFACHIVSIGYYAKSNDPIILTIIQFGTVAILSFISAFVFEDIPTNMTREGLFSIIYLAIFSTLVAFLIQNIAQKHTSSTHAAIMLSLESVFGSVLATFILGELFTIRMVIGCVTIFMAIIIAETKLDFIKRKKVNKRMIK